MKYLLKIVLVGLIILWGGSVVSSEPPLQNKNAKQNKAAAPYQQITNDKEHPLIVSPLKAPISAEDAEKEAEDHQRKNIIEFGTLIIAIATVIVLFLQWRVFRRQANLMHKTIDEMKIATKANEKAAAASKKYADMLPQVERAYCHPGGWFQNNGAEFYSDVGNYGKTPAIVNEICIEICERSALPENPDYRRKELVGLPLYPGQPPQWSRVKNRTRKDIKDPIVYGRVWYQDIFHDSHTSGFIYEVDERGGTYSIKAPAAYTEWD